MSMRTSFWAVTSLEPIRQAVSSGNSELVQELNALYGEHAEDDDISSNAHDMIMCADPPDSEPGDWSRIIRLLVQHYDLGTNDLPFNEGWKHTSSWGPYRSIVESLITPGAVKSLQWIEDGRPLRGNSIGQDGSLFAWLTAEEVGELCQSLESLDDDALEEIEAEEFDEFHEGLVDSLVSVMANSQSLLVFA